MSEKNEREAENGPARDTLRMRGLAGHGITTEERRGLPLSRVSMDRKWNPFREEQS